MLYKRLELPKHAKDDNRVAITRYLYKFVNQRSEIKRLKWHEKDYLFSHLRIITFDGGKRYDLLTIPEAKEWAFDYILLIYLGANRKIDFSRQAYDYYGRVPDARMKQHRNFFWKRMKEWKQELESGKGVYCGILRNEYQRKIKSIEQMPITEFQKNQKRLYVRATFFHIYYIIRMYFDENPNKYDMEEIGGYQVVADVYSYCHVLSRHYFWLMQEGGASLNDDIPILDIKNLPYSLLNMVKLYCTQASITPQTECLLLEYDHVNYILWLKYGRIASANIDGFQIRSFYKCETEKDICKYDGKTAFEIGEKLKCYA